MERCGGCSLDGLLFDGGGKKSSGEAAVTERGVKAGAPGFSCEPFCGVVRLERGGRRG
jgi:hypothetical protein